METQLVLLEVGNEFLDIILKMAGFRVLKNHKAKQTFFQLGQGDEVRRGAVGRIIGPADNSLEPNNHGMFRLPLFKRLT
jgi:hypothetical protein